MTDGEHQILDVVGNFFDALENGDLGACHDIMADDAVIWHNYDQIEQAKSEALASLGFLTSLKPHFRIVRRDLLPDGCVQQHVAEIRFPDGSEIDVPAIERIYCAAGRITRIEEYMDSAPMGEVMRKVQSLNRTEA